MTETIELVRQFHDAFGVAVRTTPTIDIPDDERLLRVRLILEEALEFAAAMGCDVYALDQDADGSEIRVPIVSMKEVVVDVSADPIDLIEAADALADIDYVVAGAALTLGLPHAAVVREVHRSNMSKLGLDGRPILRDGDHKVLKGQSYSPPDVAGVLRAATGP